MLTKLKVWSSYVGVPTTVLPVRVAEVETGHRGAAGETVSVRQTFLLLKPGSYSWSDANFLAAMALHPLLLGLDQRRTYECLDLGCSSRTIFYSFFF